MKVILNGGDDMISDRFDAMVALALNPNDKEALDIINGKYDDEEMPEPIYTDNYQERYMCGYDLGMRVYEAFGEHEEVVDEEDEDFDPVSSLDSLIDMINKHNHDNERDYNRRQKSAEEEYLSKFNKPVVEESPIIINDEEYHEDVIEQEEVVLESKDETEEVMEESIEEEPVSEPVVVDTKYAETVAETKDMEESGIYVNGQPMPVGWEVMLSNE